LVREDLKKQLGSEGAYQARGSEATEYLSGPAFFSPKGWREIVILILCQRTPWSVYPVHGRSMGYFPRGGTARQRGGSRGVGSYPQLIRRRADLLLYYVLTSGNKKTIYMPLHFNGRIINVGHNAFDSDTGEKVSYSIYTIASEESVITLNSKRDFKKLLNVLATITVTARPDAVNPKAYKLSLSEISPLDGSVGEGTIE